MSESAKLDHRIATAEGLYQSTRRLLDQKERGLMYAQREIRNLKRELAKVVAQRDEYAQRLGGDA